MGDTAQELLEAMFAPRVPPIEVDALCSRCGTHILLYYPSNDPTEAWEDEDGGAWCPAPQHDCPWDDEDVDLNVGCDVCESRPYHHVEEEAPR